MNSTYKIFLIDDHPIVVNSYRNILLTKSAQDKSVNFSINSVTSIRDALNYINKPSNKEIDLILLDISMPEYSDKKLFSGEQLGLYIKSNHPNSKIFVITALNNNLRLINILKKLEPDGLAVKSDLDSSSLYFAVIKILKHGKFFSQCVLNLLNNRILSDIILDDLDILLLKELANGAKSCELKELLPLTKSGIDKRKRLLKTKLGISSLSDRDLVLKAREIGFI